MGPTRRVGVGWTRKVPIRRVLLISSLLLLGLAFLVASLRYQTFDEFLRSALVEIGAAFLLLAPLLFLERRIEDEVGAVKRQVEDTRADLIQTEARLDALTPSEEVSEAVARRLAAAREDDEALF